MLIVGLWAVIAAMLTGSSLFLFPRSFQAHFVTLVLSQSFISDERAVLLLLLNTFFYTIGQQHRNTEVKSHFITQEVRVITHLHSSPRLLIRVFRYIKFYIDEETIASR